MILALLALGVALLALPGLRRVPPDRLPLHEWVPVATTSLVLGLAALEGALVLIAFPTFVHALGLAGIADSCHDVLAPLSTTPSVLGWLSGLAAAVVAVRFVTAATRARRRAEAVRAEPWLGEHHELDELTLVVLPTAAPLAFGVPGAPPQVLVSEGLVDTMPADEFDAIVRHETAHHRLRHARYLALLAGAESAAGVRPVRRSVAIIRDALEVWADDAAGRDPASRRSLRRALVALAGSHAMVRDRSRRLARYPVAAQPPVMRALWYAPVAVLGMTGALLALGWLIDGQHAFASAMGCAG
jgi:Zn-dependent protease with chaperone function